MGRERRVKETETDRLRNTVSENMCVHVLERERERERERAYVCFRERERERESFFKETETENVYT